LVTDTDITTPACSDRIVLEIESIQHETGEGPCLDAISKDITVYADDLTDDHRWPIFGPRAVTLGMRSILACRLSANRTLGTLNLYARLPRAFGATDRTTAIIFATYAGMTLAAAETIEECTISLNAEFLRTEHLQGALVAREVIGQAEGILIERERISADQAFAVLRRASQHLNIKLREVAELLVQTGDIPRN
jgi:hypothetical protein